MQSPEASKCKPSAVDEYRTINDPGLEIPLSETPSMERDYVVSPNVELALLTWSGLLPARV